MVTLPVSILGTGCVTCVTFHQEHDGVRVLYRRTGIKYIGTGESVVAAAPPAPPAAHHL